MALKRKTMEKAIKSTIAPNPKEFTHLTDFSADPDHQHITLAEKERLALVTNYDDTTIMGLINALTARVDVLENHT